MFIKINKKISLKKPPILMFNKYTRLVYLLNNSNYLGHPAIKIKTFPHKKLKKKDHFNKKFLLDKHIYIKAIKNNYFIIDLGYTTYYLRFVINFLLLCFLSKNTYQTFVYYSPKESVVQILKTTALKIKQFYKVGFKPGLFSNLKSLHDATLKKFDVQKTNLKLNIPTIIITLGCSKLESVMINKECKLTGTANITIADSNLLTNEIQLMKNNLFFLPSNDDSHTALLGLLSIINNVILKSQSLYVLNLINKVKLKHYY